MRPPSLQFWTGYESFLRAPRISNGASDGVGVPVPLRSDPGAPPNGASPDDAPNGAAAPNGVAPQ